MRQKFQICVRSPKINENLIDFLETYRITAALIQFDKLFCQIFTNKNYVLFRFLFEGSSYKNAATISVFTVCISLIDFGDIFYALKMYCMSPHDQSIRPEKRLIMWLVKYYSNQFQISLSHIFKNIFQVKAFSPQLAKIT